MICCLRGRRNGQFGDYKIQEIKEQIKEEKAPGFNVDEQ
jgi:hypothetical protein